MESGQDSIIEILKQALYLERQGRAFYSKVAEHAEDTGVSSIFSMLAAEEESHIKFLSEYFSEYSKTGKIANIAEKGMDRQAEISEKILTEDIKISIKAASYEAAAISAAIEMEKKAVILYGDRAKTAESGEEKELYGTLSRWEITHLDLLTDLNSSVAESVWNENSFWPY